MTDLPPLLAYMNTVPAQSHRPTSVAAAAKILTRISAMHRQILDYLATHPEGATDCELQEALNMNPSTQRPRRIELLTWAYLHDSGATRPTRSGRAAVVWKLT